MLAPACPTVGGSWKGFWVGSLSLTGMGIGVIIGRTADFPLVQVIGPVSAADAIYIRHEVRLNRFANKQICYIQSM